MPDRKRNNNNNYSHFTNQDQIWTDLRLHRAHREADRSHRLASFGLKDVCETQLQKNTWLFFQRREEGCAGELAEQGASECGTSASDVGFDRRGES